MKLMLEVSLKMEVVTGDIDYGEDPVGSIPKNGGSNNT